MSADTCTLIAEALREYAELDPRDFPDGIGYDVILHAAADALVGEREARQAAEKEADTWRQVYDQECAMLVGVERVAQQLRDALEPLLDALMPLLPLIGSVSGGYRVSDRIDGTLVATVEEWATAAHAWVEAREALAVEEPAETP